MEAVVSITRGRTTIQLVVEFDVSGRDIPDSWDAPGESMVCDIIGAQLSDPSDITALVTPLELAAIEEACLQAARQGIADSWAEARENMREAA